MYVTSQYLLSPWSLLLPPGPFVRQSPSPLDQPTASSRLVTNLIIGLYPDYHEKWRASILQPDKKEVLPGSGVDNSYGAFFNELVANIGQDPMQLLAWYSVHKPVLLWDWDILTGFGDIYIYPVDFSLYHISIPAIFTYSFMRSMHLLDSARRSCWPGLSFGGEQRKQIGTRSALHKSDLHKPGLCRFPIRTQVLHTPAR